MCMRPKHAGCDERVNMDVRRNVAGIQVTT